MIYLDNALVLCIVVATAWSCVAEDPERQVVARPVKTITLTESELALRIANERIKAARETMDALPPRPCNWPDLFVPPVTKPAKPQL